MYCFTRNACGKIWVEMMILESSYPFQETDSTHKTILGSTGRERRPQPNTVESSDKSRQGGTKLIS